jgi:hypothetical protein
MNFPQTTRTLTQLSALSLADAALMLVRSGSTDGKVTVGELVDYVLGPQLVASIGGSGTPSTYALTTGSWTPVDLTTAADVLEAATTDNAGVVTASLSGAGPIYAMVHWSIHCETSGSDQILAATYVDGAQVGTPQQARVTSHGQSVSGTAIVQISDTDTIQVAVRSASGSWSVDIDSLTLQVLYIPRVTPS